MSNEPQRARAGIFSHERRRFARRRLNSLAYIDLGNDSGGIVLNISEGGLAVHSAVTLNARFLPSIRFQLPHSSEWVAARGELTWIDASRKQAGLRFGALSDSARSQIRNWISSSSGDSGNPDEVSLGETMQLASITLGTIPVSRKPLPLTEVDGVREIESVDRKLRVHFARRDPAPERKARSDGAMWWSFIAAIGFLAILSFGFGWITGHGKMGIISAAIANVRAHIVAHAQNRSALPASAPSASSASAAPDDGQSPNPANGLPAAAAAPTNNSTASPSGNSNASPAGAAPALPQVTFTTQSYVPVSNDAGKSERVQQLVLGHIVQYVDPVYPSQAVSQHIEGTVQLRATVAADGTVETVSVISGDPLLASAAQAAVRQWHFAPTVLDAVPVPTEQAITIAFSLGGTATAQ